MRRETLLDMFDDGVNIAKRNAFFSGEFQLPAYTLLSEKVDQRRCQYLVAAW